MSEETSIKADELSQYVKAVIDGITQGIPAGYALYKPVIFELASVYR